MQATSPASLGAMERLPEMEIVLRVGFGVCLVVQAGLLGADNMLTTMDQNWQLPDWLFIAELAGAGVTILLCVVMMVLAGVRRIRRAETS
jgi:hypothetical protein